MRDVRAGLGHPSWQGGGVRRVFLRDLNALRLDASANFQRRSLSMPVHPTSCCKIATHLVPNVQYGY